MNNATFGGMNLDSQFATYLNDLPESLRHAFKVDWQRLTDAVGDDFPWDGLCDAGFIEGLVKAWTCSRFVTLSCISHPQMFADLVRTKVLFEMDTFTSMPERLAVVCKGTPQQPFSELAKEGDVMLYLRRFRRGEMVRIAWRDLAGFADLDETLRDLSTLANLCVTASLQWLELRQQALWGMPVNSQGELMQLVVLAMGKLGAGELNFSSDIDLIFTFAEEGLLQDGTLANGLAIKARDKTVSQYFTAVAQGLIKLLDTRTADGFVFRVDTRLRPYGSAGPLVMSFDALEQYYQNVGRDWERYALIKAQAITGSDAERLVLSQSLNPFVFRRYIDFSVIDSIRSMKAMIQREVTRKGMADNVKLGRGGIREVEFIGQALQLVHGGRDPNLQARPIREVLNLLAERELLPLYIVNELLAAYVFLRRCENRIQELADQQTHQLPSRAEDRACLSTAMGFGHWHELVLELDVHRNNVELAFSTLFDAPQIVGANDKQPAYALWEDAGAEGDELASDDLSLATGLGYKDAERLVQYLRQFRQGHLLRRLSKEGRERLDRLMPLLLAAAGQRDNPDETLKRLIEFIEAVARRSAYFDLLVENPLALGQLVRLISVSPWVAQALGQQPVLLDELLDGRSLYQPPDSREMQTDLMTRMSHVATADVEAEMTAMRQFKQAVYLRTAAAELLGALPLMKVSDTLTEVAELCLQQSLCLAWRDMCERYGEPHCELDGVVLSPGMAVIAYGKLGGLELGYGSDLDLVFLHNSQGSQQQTLAPQEGQRSVDNSVFFTRLGQRLVHYLNTITVAGPLYEIDMRLRPNGNSGLLVSSLGAFESYQHKQAWTWEHQALVRARFVAGDAAVGQSFSLLRRDLLCQPRDELPLRDDVRTMRVKMREALGSNNPANFDLKQDPGGIVDIEFMVQYAVLAWSVAHPALCDWTDNIRILASLAERGLISEADAELLSQTYLAYRSRSHEYALQGLSPRLPVDEFEGYRNAVMAVWQTLIGGG